VSSRNNTVELDLFDTILGEGSEIIFKTFSNECVISISGSSVVLNLGYSPYYDLQWKVTLLEYVFTHLFQKTLREI
jgi:hypothetical protein